MDTQWERAGFGWWKRKGDAVLRVFSTRGNMSGEVIASEQTGAIVQVFSSQLSDEAAAKAWCERWSDCILREVEKG